MEGWRDVLGAMEGNCVGPAEGTNDGNLVGVVEGIFDGWTLSDGEFDGRVDGVKEVVGISECALEGLKEGI